MYAINLGIRFPYNGFIAITPKLASAFFSTAPNTQRNWKSDTLIKSAPWEFEKKSSKKKRTEIRRMVPPPGMDLSPGVLGVPPSTSSPSVPFVTGKERY